MFKYTLIISQYYHSRHYFIVKHDENFIKNARDFAVELMQYKRDETNERDMYLGDLDPEYSDDRPIRQRYNINDSGDIYFLQSDWANRLMKESWGYRDDSRRENYGFKSKKVLQDIDDHHNYKKVKEFVEKYFEIA